MSSGVVCDRFNVYKQANNTGVIKGFEGIPQNFTIDICAFILIFIVFCIIRKKAWNYGRIALYKSDEINQLDVGEYNVWKFVSYGTLDKTHTEDYSQDDEYDKMARSRAYSVDDKTAVFDQGYFNWIRFFWGLTERDIQNKAGSDAYQYLVFERYLIFVTFLMTLMCIFFFIPLHIYGANKNVTNVEFVSTTLLNLPSNSPLIWIHAIVSFVMFFLIICVIWRYTVRVKIVAIKETSNTLMIEGIPKKYCFKSFVVDHFKLAYPECKVHDIHFAHNVKKLIDLNLKRESAVHARQAAIDIYKQTGSRPTMVPIIGGKFICCCAKQVDVVDYYDTEVAHLDLRVEAEKLQAFENKIGIAFVTFLNLEHATDVNEDYQTECCMPNYPRVSTLSTDLKTSAWNVQYAPPSNVINWENLSSSSRRWYLKAFLINSVVFILLFLLTTPTYVLNVLQLNNKSQKFINNFLYRYIQSFILWLVSVILPFSVYYSEILIGHWTKVSEHRNVFLKTYIYLIIMVLIFPSLGIASIPAFIKWLLPINKPILPYTENATTNDMGKFMAQWLCVYAPGNGAFFVNYLITASLLGTIAELVRIPDLLIYLYYQIVVKSSAEMWGIRKRVLWEFQFGLSYSWLLCVFAVTVTYSIICPLVAPFGFLYLLLRYIFDKYNLYFAYDRSFIDARIHRLALAFTVFAFLLLQVNLLVYLKVKGTEGNLIFVFVLSSFMLCLALFVIFTINGWFTQTKTHYLLSKDFTSSDTKSEFESTTQFMQPFFNVLGLNKFNLSGLTGLTGTNTPTGISIDDKLEFESIPGETTSQITADDQRLVQSNK